MAPHGSPAGKQFWTLCLRAGVSPGCCSLIWYQTCKWGRSSPASALSSSFAHIQTRWGKKPARGVQGQKPSTGGLAVTHHHVRSCPTSFASSSWAPKCGVLGSFLRFNSKGAPSIHQGSYYPSSSNPDGLCSYASLVPTPALPWHPTQGIFPSPILQVSFLLHSSYQSLFRFICTGFSSHSPSLSMTRSLLPTPSPLPKKSLCSYGAWF